MQVAFKNTRFDPKSTQIFKIAEQMADAFGYRAEGLKTSKELSQLLRLSVAQKNKCAYCITLHAKSAREIGIPEEKVDQIATWQGSELFNEVEKAALSYADALSDGNLENFAKVHQIMTRYFRDFEIIEIASIVINMNVWTRLKLAQGQTPYFK